MTRHLPFYRCKKHLGLDVNVKNSSVCETEEVSCRDTISFCGDGGGDCGRYPKVVSNSIFRGGQLIDAQRAGIRP